MKHRQNSILTLKGSPMDKYVYLYYSGIYSSFVYADSLNEVQAEVISPGYSSHEEAENAAREMGYLIKSLDY